MINNFISLKSKLNIALILFTLFFIKPSYAASMNGQGSAQGNLLSGAMNPLFPLYAPPMANPGLGIQSLMNIEPNQFTAPIASIELNNMVNVPSIGGIISSGPMNAFTWIGNTGFGMSNTGLSGPSLPMFGLSEISNMTRVNLPGNGFIPLGTGPVMNFTMDPMYGFHFQPLSMMNFNKSPMVGFNPSPMMNFTMDPMYGFHFQPLSMMNFNKDPLVVFNPGPMMNFTMGPMYCFHQNPSLNFTMTNFPALDTGPTLYYPLIPNNLASINSGSKTSQTNSNNQRRGNGRFIYLGDTIRGTRPDGKPNIIRHYLDTFTNKKLNAHKKGVGYLPEQAPDYEWWYGCSPTSVGMIMGYYDVWGYNGITYDLVLGGTAELNSFGLDSLYPAGPTLLCNKAIASAGHITDFYISYGDTSPDPLASGRIIPDQFDCLADFMGTSQNNLTSLGEGNPDGTTTIWSYEDGTPMTDTDIFNFGYDVYNNSGLYGVIEYIQYCGYTATGFNQYIQGYLGNTLGFTFVNFMNEIDSGRPVWLHLTGHDIIAYGYDELTQEVLVHDTLNNSLYDLWTIPWGNAEFTYDGLLYELESVTCLTLL